MKNAMKKLMALVLVAMMLVSAVPFGVAADEREVVTVMVHKNNGYAPELNFEMYKDTVTSPSAVYNTFLTTNHGLNTDGIIDNCISFDDGTATATIPDSYNVVHFWFSYSESTNEGNNDDNNKIEEPEINSNTNECDGTYDCPVDYPYHKAGCASIPCTGAETGECDHGGWSHDADCPKACDGTVNCPQAANSDPRYHVAGCDSQEEPEETTNPTEDKDDDDNVIVDPYAAYARARIHIGGRNSYESRMYPYAIGVDEVVEYFDDYDTDYHYEFDYYVKDGNKYTDEDDTIQLGELVDIYIKKTESKLNDNKVYLQIYLNNDFDAPVKTLNVTNGIAEGGLYLYGDVEDLILDYFSAKTDSGVKLDGMYYSVGSWVANFLEDEKVERVSEDKIIEMKEDSFVVFNIMVTNAKLKSSSTADSSNPKTGDTIMVPVAIMGVSACALAVAFYLNKKRAM